MISFIAWNVEISKQNYSWNVNHQQQQNDAYHQQEDDWMPLINNQVDPLYGHDQRMIGSYQLLHGSIKKWRYDPSNKKYRNNVYIGMDTNQDQYSLISINCWLMNHETTWYYLYFWSSYQSVSNSKYINVIDEENW